MISDDQLTMFSHVYQRSDGPVIRTVWSTAQHKEVWVQFADEEPYILNLSDNPDAQVEQMRHDVINADHALALQMEHEEWLAISR
jgi:hypothetical protein